MSWVAAAIGGGALVGAGASLWASNTQKNSSDAALAQQNKIYQNTQADLSPYKKVGSGALMTLGQLYGIGADGKPTGQSYNPASTDAFRNSPDYKFAFDQGNQALTFSNAAKGLLKSGSNLKDIVGFGQGLASQQFGNYVNRLSGLATMGQNSAAGGATNGLAFANMAGNTGMAGGQAAASGVVGAANSLTGGVGSYLNYNQQQQNNQILQGMVNNKTGGNNAVGSVPVSSPTVPHELNDTSPMYGFADGGRPPTNRPVMVGERGPELFVPDQPNRGSWGGGWQGSPGWDGGRPGQPGMPQNGLANAWGGWASMLGGGQPNGQTHNGLANAWGNMFQGGQFGGPGGQPPTFDAVNQGGTWGLPNANNGLSAANRFRGLGGLPGFADGGRPPTGQPAIVGENGPEIFVPDRPNEQEIAAIYNLPPELRARGIAELKRKMGGDAPWYMERTPPAWVPSNQQTQMFNAIDVSNRVPRGFAKGGRPPVGEPIVVGENGPEVVQMDQPGTVVPNHELPLWLESGMEGAPPYHPPMNRAVEDYSSRDPNELAMMRHREMARPQAGRADFTPQHLANMATAAAALSPAGAMLAPEILAARAAMAAPKVAAGVAGTMAALSPSMAGEQEFKWTDQDTARTKEMQDIQNRISGRAAQITTLGTTKTNSPAGTQASTIKSLEALNHPEGADMKRLTELRQQAAAERDSAFNQWQFEQQRARDQAEAKRKSEQSLFDMVPGTRQAIAVGAPIAAAWGGYGLGRKVGPWAGMAYGALGGGLESAAAIGIPTEADYRGLPETSPAQQKAAQDLDSWDWYRRAAGMTAINAGIGAMGGFKGGMSRRGVLPMSTGPVTGPTPPPNMALSATTPPVMPTNSLAAASQLPPLPVAPIPPNALAAASVMVVKDKNGRTIYMNRSGGFAKKEDIDRFLNPRGNP